MHSFLNEHTVRRVAGWCALISLVFAIGMAFEYGRAMSWLHAGTLGLLAIAVPVAFIGADMMRSQGRNITATLLVVAGTAMSIGEYMTHFGYTVGSRIADTQQTGVQNATYEAVQQNRESESKNMDLWRKQKADLQAERAKMVSATPWATTLTANALRDEIKDLDDRIVAETNGQRGGRKAGCRAECEKLKDQRKVVAEKLAGVEKLDVVDNRIKELDKQLEATQRILDKKVDVAAKTEFHSSKIVNQTQAFAQLAAWDDKPTDTVKSWVQLVLGAIIAFITTYLTLVFTTVAFGSHKIKPSLGNDDHPVGGLGNRTPEPRAYSPSPQGTPLEPIHVHTVEHVTDKTLASWARSCSDDIRAMLEPKQLRTA